MRNSGKDRLIIAAVVSILAAACFGGLYLWQAEQYRDVFLTNTYINGINASGKTVTEVKTLINAGIEGYQLRITGRNHAAESLSGASINLRSEFDGSLEEILEKQNPYAWGKHAFAVESHQIEKMVMYDSQLLQKELENLDLLDENLAEEPEDAYIAEYVSGQGYEIAPEKEGSLVNPEVSVQGIRKALLNLQPDISLEDLKAYVPPEVRSTDEHLLASQEARNRYVNVAITYEFGEQTEVLNGDTIHSWITFDARDTLSIDEEAVASYVAELGKKYNTAYEPKTLKTSYGDTVTITGGNYGWRINQSAEVAAVCEIIRSGESQSREPIYSQTAASHGDTDYGDTYVEINLTAQHLYYYQDGKLVVESDFVSGNESRGWSTPAGAFLLTYKQRNATLKGEGYATPVDYWMPFNGGIGLHDAGWRSSFGGAIYKTNGSHGCINLPPAVARTIYGSISAGVPVLCYHLEGTAGSPSTVPRSQLQTPPETLPVPLETGQNPEGLPETAAALPETAADLTEPAADPDEMTTASPGAETQGQYPVIIAPGGENSAEQMNQPEPTAAAAPETEAQTSAWPGNGELPIVGPGGVPYESRPEVGPGV